jgi:hypothetical protein
MVPGHPPIHTKELMTFVIGGLGLMAETHAVLES